MISMKKIGNSFLSENFTDITRTNGTPLSIEYLWFAGVCTIILFSYGLLHPLPGQNLLQIKNHVLLGIFIERIEKQGFQEKEWWEFRQKYSSGNFSYNADVLYPYSILELGTIANVPVELFFYRSSLINSTDLIVSNPVLTLSDTSIDYEKLYVTDTVLLYKDKQSNKIYLERILPFATLKKFNGLINSESVPSLEGAYWLTKATINN